MRRAWVVLLLCSRAFAQPADWTPTRDSFDPHVIARYEAILAANPFDDAILAKLDRLYSGHHTVEELESDLGETASGLAIRARLHLRHKDPTAALPLLERAAALAPPFEAACWLAIAELRRGANDTAGAREAYEKTLAALPSQAMQKIALRELANLAAIAKGDADTYFVQLLALSPNDPELWTARGDALVARNHPEQAIDSYNAAEQFAPDLHHRIEAIARRGDAFARMHDTNNASAEYRRAIALAPAGSVADLMTKLVEVARDNHALAELAHTLELEWPDRKRDAQKWATIGAIYSETDERDLAVNALQYATKLAPWDLASQRLLVALYDALERRADSQRQLAAAIRAAPSEPTLQISLAQHTWPNLRALDLLDGTAKQFASDASVLEGIAKQFIDWEHPARAERWIELIIKMEPDEVDHWMALVQAYLRANDLEGALKAWHRVAREMPGAKLRFAELLLDEHQPGLALTLVDESIALYGLDPDAFRIRAVAHADLFDTTAAIEDALREVSLEPPDYVSQHRGHHHVAALVAALRTAGLEQHAHWAHYISAWHDAFWADKPDITAGYLYLETLGINGWQEDTLLAFDDLRETAMRLEKLVPDDMNVLRLEARMFEAHGLQRLAANMLRRIAVLDPHAAPMIAKEIERMEGLYGNLGDAYDPHIGEQIEAPPQPVTYNPHWWDGGFAIDLGAAMHGELGSSVGLGLYVDHALSEPYHARQYTAFEFRADFDQRSGAMSGGTSFSMAAGLWRNLVSNGIGTLRYGLDGRTEVRLGDCACDRVGVGVDAGVALGLRAAPIDLGVRVQQWLVGGYDSRAILELRVRLL